MRFIIFALLLCLPLVALAEEPGAHPATATSATAGVTATTLTLDDAAITARLTDIQTTLENRRKHADYWFYGWLSFYGAATVGQVVIGALSDSEKIRAGNYVGAATSLLGVSGMLISPIPTGRVADDVQALPKGSPEERQASLVEAEQILAKTQAGELRARHWTEHLLGGVVSGGAAAIMYFYYDDWENALMKLGGGLVFGQPRTLTGPIAHHDVWPSYQPASALPSSVTGLDSIRLIPTPKGVLATMNF